MRKQNLDLRVHDRVALDEVELYAELLSAVARADGPLTQEEIDSVLSVRPEPSHSAAGAKVLAAARSESLTDSRTQRRAGNHTQSGTPHSGFPVSPAEVYRQARRQAAAKRTAYDVHAGLERLNQWMAQEPDSVGDMSARPSAMVGPRCDVDDAGPVASPRRIRVDDLAGEIIAGLRLATPHELGFTAEVAWARMDQLALWRAMRNVLDNACRVARGRVDMRVFIDQGRIVIQVDDDGPGFGAGSGGLSSPDLGIVHDLISGHGGSLEIRPGEMGGARVRILLPAASHPAPGSEMRVLICDDHAVFADSLALVLGDAGCSVVGVTYTLDDALTVLRNRPADICLIDLRFPADNALDRLAELQAATSDTRFVVLSGFVDHEIIEAGVRAGAHGFAHKGQQASEILTILRRVHNGEVVIDRRRGSARPHSQAHRVAQFLTPREREVLTRLARGESTAALAKAMGVTRSAARSHVQSVLTKLGVDSQREAVIEATRNGLVSVETGEWLVS